MINNLKTINKLVIKSEKFDDNFLISTYEHQYLYNFFEPLKTPEYLEIIIKINEFLYILDNEIDNSIKAGGNTFELEKKDINLIYSLYLLNSFLKSSSIENNINFNYIYMDEILNSIVEYENKFWLYYYSSVSLNKEDFKKKFASIIYALVAKGIIFENKITEKIKSRIYISIGHTSQRNRMIEKANISEKPYSIRVIAGEFYLIGDSFLNTTELFRKNSYSNRTIKILDNEFIRKLKERYVIFDKNDFYRVKKIFEINSNTKIDDVQTKINENMVKEKEITKEINDIKYKINENSNFHVDIIEDEIFNNYNLEPTPFNILLYSYNYIFSEILGVDFKKMLTVNYIQKNFSVEEILTCKISSSEKFLENLNENLCEYKSLNKETINKALLVKIVKNNKKKIAFIFSKLKKSDALNNFYYTSYKEINIKEDQLKEIKKKTSNLYILNTFKIIEDLNIFDKPIYIPFFFDFRSRKYDDSSFGVTSFVASRYIINYGVYTSDIDGKSAYTGFIKHNYIRYINEIKKKFNIENDKSYIIDGIFWCLIGIGKNFRKKNQVAYTIDTFLAKAVEIIDTYKVNYENLEDTLTYFHYIEIIKSFKDKNIKKRLVHKDATASFIQNLIRIIGPKNENSLILANLKSKDTWYDTYNLCLEEWKKTLDCKSNENLKYFTRSTIKLPLMTASYDSTYLTRLKYFKDKIKEDFSLQYIPFSVIPLFKNFYNFVEKNFWNDYFIKNKPEILNEIIKNNIEKNTSVKQALIKSSVVIADIIYFKSTIEKKVITLSFKNEDNLIKIRRTKNIYIIDDTQLFLRKMNQSLKANWVHFSDATLCIQINNNYKVPYLTIHDCFLVDVLSVSKFIATANKEFSNIIDLTIDDKENLKEISSIFIFI